MSGWPTPDGADDRRLAAALRDGDHDALAQVFDVHAARLYDYCHALVRDQDAAAQALHATLVAARLNVWRLREEDRFRGWLYALARNECLRRLADPDRPVQRVEAPEVEDAFQDAEQRAGLQETRQLIHGSLSVLTGRQREALDLQLRHGLDVYEIGMVLGVNAKAATDLTGDARTRLDEALAAAMIARVGRGSCPQVARLVETWEWPLAPAAYRRIIKHIGSCATCARLRDRKVSTGRLLQVLPIAMMPQTLRAEVLAAAARGDGDGEQTLIAEQDGRFDTWGRPIPVQSATRGLRRWPVPVVTAALVATVTAVVLWSPGGSDQRAGAVSTPTVAAPAETGVTSPPPGTDDESPEPSESPEPATTVSASESPSAARPPSAPGSTRPPSRSRPAPRPPAPGTLAVSGCTAAGAGGSCAITVRAVGGRVTWSVTGTSGGVAAGGGGTLASGGTATVTATAGSCGEAGGAQSGSVQFSPGGSASVGWTCPEPPDPPAGGGEGPAG